MDIITEANKIIRQSQNNLKRQREAEVVFVTFVTVGQVLYNIYHQGEPMKVLFTSMLEIFDEKGFKVVRDKCVDHYSEAIGQLDHQKSCGIDPEEIWDTLTMYFKCSVWGVAVK